MSAILWTTFLINFFKESVDQVLDFNKFSPDGAISITREVVQGYERSNSTNLF